MVEQFFRCSFFAVHLRVTAWHIITRIQAIFCCAHKIFQSIIRDGAILIVFNFFVCVLDVRAWLFVVVVAVVTVVALFSMPFNNFINYAFSSLTNNIAKVFVYGLSNDLKSIKCCRTLKWYLPFFILCSQQTHADARTHQRILLYYFELNAMNLSNSVELSLGTQFILYYSTDLTFQIPPSPHALTPRVCSHKMKYKLLFCALLHVSWAKNEDENETRK